MSVAAIVNKFVPMVADLMLRTGHDPRVYRTADASYSDYDAEDHRLDRNVVAEESEKRRRPEHAKGPKFRLNARQSSLISDGISLNRMC